MSRHLPPMVASMSSKPFRARSLGFQCSLSVLAAAAALVTPAVAQQAPAAAQQPEEPAIETEPLEATTGVVRRIVVTGNQRIDSSTILSYLPIQPGDTVDSVALDLGVRTLYRTELFA